jgi:hypothetical protein
MPPFDLRFPDRAFREWCGNLKLAEFDNTSFDREIVAPPKLKNNNRC